MFKPQYCKDRVDYSFHQLMKQVMKDETSWLVWYWSSALCKWARELEKVRQQINDDTN